MTSLRILKAVLIFSSIGLVIFGQVFPIFLFCRARPACAECIIRFHHANAGVAYHVHHVSDVGGRGILTEESARAKRTGLSGQKLLPQNSVVLFNLLLVWAKGGSKA